MTTEPDIEEYAHGGSPREWEDEYGQREPVSTSNPHPTPDPRQEWITAAAEAIEEAAIPRIGRDLGTIHRDEIVAAGLRAALAMVAYEIRAELVCCDVYDRDAGTDRAGETHPICFWSEAAARIVEQRPDAPAESPVGASVVSAEGSGQGQPHWTIQLGREDARRWLAGEPRITDAEKEAFRERVEGSGLRCSSREPGGRHGCDLPSGHDGMHQVRVTRFFADGSGEGSGHPQPATSRHVLSRNGRVSVLCVDGADGCEGNAETCACSCHNPTEGES